jgi:hypothetical protein
MAKLMNEALLPPRFLFRFEAPIARTDAKWSDVGVTLDDPHQLLNLGELDAARQFADVRAAWSDAGLFFVVRVAGKSKPPWCRDSRLEDSDGLQVWIDTRATHNIHRATKYCHRFVFLPAGGGRKFDQPVADQLLINRARENARPVRPRELKVAAQPHKTGYALGAFIPAIALGGYDPSEHRSLGFQYAVYDRELGLQTFSTGPGLPYDEDPSLWATLEMVE